MNVYDIHKFHKCENGWSDIGYHFFIDKKGYVYRGRPENAIGAHCLNHNTHSLGICVQGNYMLETMPDVQKQSVINLCKYLLTKYNIRDIKAHNALNSTDCPGKNYPLNKTTPCNYIVKKSNIKDTFIKTFFKSVYILSLYSFL